MLQCIGEYGARAAELLLDHISNLLDLCERSASEIAGAPELLNRTASIVEQPDALATRASTNGPRRGKWLQTLQLYEELCVLLAPHENEVQGLWTGLRKRNWEPDRVDRLNAQLLQPHSPR